MRMTEETRLPQPDLATVEIGTVLQALADPVRLQIVRLLDTVGEAPCGALELPVGRSTVSHHLRTLRESGLVETHLRGNTRVSRIRGEELERRFPGLLPSVLGARPAAPGTTAADGGEGER
ncbi:ArsR/SmtB family transcription factor [Streptomyces achromogenes]|uniref:ArsR/SmtB family transcription factor n=2 Tax=Streptomyces achromogenes TaxID=67255 RepID=UPI003700F36B